MTTAGLFNMLGGGDEAAMQRQLDEQRATKFAEMTQDQRFANMGYSAGAGLGRGIAGAFGVDVRDPEVRAAAMKQRIANEIDYTDLVSVAEGVRKLAQGGFAEEARQLAAALETTKKTRAEAEAKLAEKLPNDVRTARELSSLKLKIAGLKRMDQADPAVKQTLETSQAQYDALSGLTAKEGKTPSFGAEAERYSLQFYKKPYSDLTSEEMAKVNAKVEETAKDRTPKIILPGQPVEPKDWLKFREFADTTPVMQKTSALLSELPNALETIRMSTSNDIAAAALPKALASVAGEGKVTSNADIQRYARTGGLDERLIQGATNFITGRATQTKKAEAEKYASAVYRGALLERKKFIQSEAKQLGYDQSPNYSQAVADIDAELAKFKKPSDNKPVDSVVRVKPTGNPLIDKYLNVQTP